MRTSKINNLFIKYILIIKLFFLKKYSYYHVHRQLLPVPSLPPPDCGLRPRPTCDNFFSIFLSLYLFYNFIFMAVGLRKKG